MSRSDIKRVFQNSETFKTGDILSNIVKSLDTDNLGKKVIDKVFSDKTTTLFKLPFVSNSISSLTLYSKLPIDTLIASDFAQLVKIYCSVLSSEILAEEYFEADCERIKKFAISTHKEKIANRITEGKNPLLIYFVNKRPYINVSTIGDLLIRSIKAELVRERVAETAVKSIISSCNTMINYIKSNTNEKYKSTQQYAKIQQTPRVSCNGTNDLLNVISNTALALLMKEKNDLDWWYSLFEGTEYTPGQVEKLENLPSSSTSSHRYKGSDPDDDEEEESDLIPTPQPAKKTPPTSSSGFSSPPKKQSSSSIRFTEEYSDDDVDKSKSSKSKKDSDLGDLSTLQSQSSKHTIKPPSTSPSMIYNRNGSDKKKGTIDSSSIVNYSRPEEESRKKKTTSSSSIPPPKKESSKELSSFDWEYDSNGNKINKDEDEEEEKKEEPPVVEEIKESDKKKPSSDSLKSSSTPPPKKESSKASSLTDLHFSEDEEPNSVSEAFIDNEQQEPQETQEERKNILDVVVQTLKRKQAGYGYETEVIDLYSLAVNLVSLVKILSSANIYNSEDVTNDTWFKILEAIKSAIDRQLSTGGEFTKAFSAHPETLFGESLIKRGYITLSDKFKGYSNSQPIYVGEVQNMINQSIAFINDVSEKRDMPVLKPPAIPLAIDPAIKAAEIYNSNNKNPNCLYGTNETEIVTKSYYERMEEDLIKDLVKRGIIDKAEIGGETKYVYNNSVFTKDELLKIIKKAKVNEFIQSRSIFSNTQLKQMKVGEAARERLRKRKEKYISINKSTKSKVQALFDEKKVVGNGLVINPLLFKKNML